jgi:hypothetical protein
MGSKARIHDSKALLETKAAVASFIETVNAALSSMDADVSRVSLWLNQDRPSHWKHEIRRREDQVMAIKTDMHRKIIAQAPEPVSLVLERKALAKAQERVEEARRRQEASRRWGVSWEREAQLYKSGLVDLLAALHGILPKGIHRLERMLLTLEQYERLEAPPTQVDQSSPESDASDEGDAPKEPR